MQWQFIKVCILICTIWVLTLLFVMKISFPSYDPTDLHLPDTTKLQLIARIDAAFEELETLKEINLEIKNIIDQQLLSQNVKSEITYSVYESKIPSVEYENNARLLELNLKELMYTIQSKNDTYLKGINFEQVRDIYRLLRGHLQKMRISDGYELERAKQTEELSSIVQNKIHALQNPNNCNSAKKLVCELNKECGFGCQIHHVCYCLIVAYATGRMLVLDSTNWRYNPAGWEAVFQPLSKSCYETNYSVDFVKLDPWLDIHNSSNAQVLFLPIVDALDTIPPFLPVVIPSDISSMLEKIHGEPHIWWVGQFMSYILRPQPQLQVILDEAKERMGIIPGTVGIHVRRTDKIGTEAAYHALDEYMYHADEYFAILEAANRPGSKIQRRVFIASDDPAVIREAKIKYREPRWKILGNLKTAEAASVQRRYNDGGLNGIIQDVVLLSECDLLVCTFSSQVGRLAYELMQSKRVDASGRFMSLDNVYHYGGGNPLHQEVVIPHQPTNPYELELRLGDELILAGNHWNGTSTGTNLRTNRVGLYPSYKAINKYTKTNFHDLKEKVELQ